MDDQCTSTTATPAAITPTPQWKSFLSGWLAGFANISATFPLHKAMFRQMLYGVPTTKAFSQLRKEGLGNLYRGIGPPLCQKTVSIAIMFGSYKYFTDVICHAVPSLNGQVCQWLGASMAGLIEVPYSQPFERVQTLLQDRTYNSKFNNTLHAAKFIYQRHGITEFYRGSTPVAIRNMTSNIVFFTTLEHVHYILPRPDSKFSRYVSDFVSGGLIGALTSTLLYPTNVIKTRMQSSLGGPFQSPAHVFRILVEERGSFRSLYRGVHLNFSRSLLSWGITTAFYKLFFEHFGNS